MKRILLLLTLLLTINAKAENKSVEIGASTTAYIEPVNHKCGSCSVSSTDGLKLGAVADYQEMHGLMYFKFNNSGTAKFELLVSNQSDGRKLKVDFNGLAKEINIPITDGFEYVTIFDEEIQGKEYYSCLTLWNIAGEGNIYIQKLQITAEEEVCEGIEFNRGTGKNAERCAPYLDLLYSHGGSRNAAIESFYNEVTVYEEYEGTYAAALAWGGLTHGYAGLDSHSNTFRDGHELMYALWNTGDRDDDEVGYRADKWKTADDIHVYRFTGEGEGVRLKKLNMNWRTGKTYCFLVNTKVSTATEGSTGTISETTFYTLYWKEKGENTWRFHGIIMSPYNGWHMKSLHSFLENFQGYTGHLFRKVRYANQWVKLVDGEWKEMLCASPAHMPSHGVDRTDKGYSIDGNGFILWSGGYLPSDDSFDELIYREPTGGQPPVTAADEQIFERNLITATNLIKNPKSIEYYDLKGNRVTDIQKNTIYITNTGEKVMFSR
jgi:hypothetical protein